MPKIINEDIQVIVKKKFNNYIDNSFEIEVPNSEITNRSSIPDLRNDLRCSLGSNRIVVQKIAKVPFEYSKDSNIPGAWVYHSTGNDPFDQMRFVGEWTIKDAKDTHDGGAGAEIAVVDGFVEIVWFGTDLIMLCNYNTGSIDVRATLDGGSEGGSTITPDIGNTINLSENVPPFLPIPVSTGQTLGLHTSKIRWNSGQALLIQGFDVYNDSTQININPGVAFIDGNQITSTGDTLDYDDTTAFDNGQSLGTSGGRVSVYVDHQGGIGRSLRDVTNELITADFTGTVDHTNEEIIGTHIPRAFGRNSNKNGLLHQQPNTSFDGYFIQDDNQTYMWCDDCQFDDVNFSTFIPGSVAADEFVFTFVGTGIDFLQTDPGTITTTYDVYLDDTLTENASTIFQVAEGVLVPLYSGLDYGTHIIRIAIDTAGIDAGFERFYVYGPKKPHLPVKAIELSEYFLTGDFSVNSTVGRDSLAQGIIRHGIKREWLLEGTWTDSLSIGTRITGIDVNTSTATDTAKFYFYGTGFELRFEADSTASTDINVDVDGTSDFSGDTSSVYGTGVTFTDSTGTLDVSGGTAQVGCGLEISGLTLGFHELTLTNNNANLCRISCIDIITPLHTPNKQLQNEILNMSYMVGGQNIKDCRLFESIPAEAITLKTWVSGPTNSSITVGTGLEQPMEDMTAVLIKDFDGLVEISWSGFLEQSSSGNNVAHIYIDGKQAFPETLGVVITSSVNHDEMGALYFVRYLSKGTHIIQVYWSASAGTGRNDNGERKLSIKELR